MSYILDALKKSDKQRKQTPVPDLNTTPLELAASKKKKAWWPITIAAIVLANVIFILFFVKLQKQPATETQAIVHGSDPTEVEERQKAIALESTPELQPVNHEPHQSELAAAEAENTVANMTEDKTASRQDSAAATSMSDEETAAGPQLQEEAYGENTQGRGSEVANKSALQATPAPSPVSHEPLQSGLAASEDESAVASMAEESGSLQNHAAAPISEEEKAADPQLQEDAYVEDKQENGSEVASKSAPRKDVAIASESVSPRTATPAEEYPEKPEQDQSPHLLPVETADSRPNEPKDSLRKQALRINQLPGAIRQQLPDIHIGAYLYKNNPAERLASINGKILREGQMFTPDIQVAEISTNGVIFRYQKYLFYVSVF
ncbi:MAG: general secretion pathway protein GspB [Pseudomonadota bacterium]